MWQGASTMINEANDGCSEIRDVTVIVTCTTSLVHTSV